MMEDSKEKHPRRRGVEGEIDKMNSSMMRRKTSKKGCLALRSVLGGQGDGWRTLRMAVWNAKHVAV